MPSHSAVPVLEPRGAHVAQYPVQACALVVGRDQLGDCGPRLRAVPICLAMGELPLQGGEERLGRRVVLAVPRMAHALAEPVRRDRAVRRTMRMNRIRSGMCQKTVSAPRTAATACPPHCPKRFKPGADR